jgi:hypothetical protein
VRTVGVGNGRKVSSAMTGPALAHTAARPWWISLIDDGSASHAHTAVADAMLRAIERALYDRRTSINRQTFGWYERERRLAVDDQQRRARIAVRTFSSPRREKIK